jgi:transcriptional regulator with XRE-family HTH domain
MVVRLIDTRGTGGAMANNRLQTVLNNEQISQADLAAASGVGTGTISKICNRKTNPAPATKKKIVTGLNRLASITYNILEIFP